DTSDEPDETFTVNLTSPVNAQIADSQGVGTIRDDDPLPVLSVADVSTAEGQSGTKTLTFTATLSAPSGQTVAFTYTTANGTAAAGSDYVAKSGSVSFFPGTTSQTISITVNGDTVAEGDETFFLDITGVTNATLGDGEAVGTLLEDDSLRVNDAVVTETDTGTVGAVFTVSLAAPLPYQVSVDYTTAAGTATAGVDFAPISGTVVFAPGETSRQVVVPVIGDLLDEADKTFALNLSNPVNTLLADGQGIATIVDNDDLPSLTVADVAVAEGN